MATTVDVSEHYQRAWTQLSELVEQRERLLYLLSACASTANARLLEKDTVPEFDLPSARRILRSIEQLTRKINATMKELNGYASEMGRPPVSWRS